MSLAWESRAGSDVAGDAEGLRYRVAPLRAGRWAASVLIPREGMRRIDACASRADARAACDAWSADVAAALAQVPLFADMGGKVLACDVVCGAPRPRKVKTKAPRAPLVELNQASMGL